MTRKKKRDQKLKLARKTVAVLDKEQLKGVQGGTGEETDACGTAGCEPGVTDNCEVYCTIPNCRFTITR